MTGRRSFLATLAVAALACLPPRAGAHHGIIWVEDEPITITGRVVREMTGYPHYEMRLQVGDTRWTVDLGNSFRLRKAGLSGDGSDMPLGMEIGVFGYPAADDALKLIRARAILIDGREHVLFEEDERHY